MGNYKIKLSDMFPNAWLYKLKGMGSSRPKTHQKRSKRPAKKKPPNPPPKQSHCYYTLDSISKPKFSDSPAELIPSTTVSPDPPRKCKKKKRAPTTFSSSMSAGCSFHASFGSDRRPLVVEPLNNVLSWSSSCCCGVVSSAAADIIIELDGKESLNSKRDRFDHGFDTRPEDGKTTFSREFDEFDSCFGSILMAGKGSFELEKFDDEHLFNTMPELELPPILTKPPKFSDLILELKEQKSTSKFGCSARMEGQSAHSYYEPHASAQVMKEESISARSRRSTSSHGVRIRANSPRLASKKIQLYNRRNSPAATRRKRVAESIAVVKSSSDPLRDFRDSMVEMIVENNIETSKDLEDLLACYLSLNSSEYHDVIVQVFVQIWIDLTDKFL